MNDAPAATGEVLPPESKTPIAEYSITVAALAQLREKFGAVVFNVAVPKEMEAAKKARAELRTLRIDLEKKRMELNADDHESIKKRNNEAKRITEQITALEDPIDETIKVEEERREKEREAKEAAEKARLQKMHDTIAAVSALPTAMINKGSADIEACIAELTGRVLDCPDMQATADDAKARALAVLTEMLANTRALDVAREHARVAAEAEAARKVEEAAEAARLHAAEVERQAKARASIEAEQAESRARLGAEQEEARAKIEAERRAEAAAKKIRDEQEAAARAIREEDERVEREKRREEQARLDAEAARLASERREFELEQAEVASAKNMLILFKSRFGERKEFAAVVKAIDAYLGART